MIALIAAALLAGETAPGLGDAVQALHAGRLEQARLIIDAAVQAGTSGDEVDRLLAEHAYLSRDWNAAFGRYEKLAALHPSETLTLERAGIAAVQLRKLDRASALLRAATALPGASWRAWNALGAVADLQLDWGAADAAYTRAHELGPDRAEVFNNHGWSLLMRGGWQEALPLLEKAAALDPKARRIADNLELARAALAENLPRRRAGESDSEWAARLNDAGVLAVAGGQRQRAIAAFSQAIEANSQWFERAANNLAIVEGRD